MRKTKSEVFYAESIERVWKALTDSSELAQWFMGGDFEAKAGHRFRWKNSDPKDNPFEGAECEVEEVEAPGRLTFKVTHSPGALVSFVTWSLEKEGDGTRFIVEQEFLAQSDLKPHPSVVSIALYRQHRAQRCIMIKSDIKWSLFFKLLQAYLSEQSFKVAA